jgi:two-component system chemotaxis sensor kinase CheA
MNALLAQFIPEARDLLDQAGTGMLALERDAGSPRAINDVFRAVHTLKGSSGLFDVAPLTRLVHAAEDLLGEVRTGELALNSDIVDRLLDSLDVVGRWVDALEAREALPGDAETVMAERVAVLRGWLDRREPAPAAGSGSAAPLRAAPAPPPGWLAQLPEADRLSAFAAASQTRLLAWSFVPEEDCFFRGDDPLAMVRQSPGLLAVRVVPRDAGPAFDALDPLTSWLRFDVLSDAPRDTLEEHMRYVADAVDIRPIDLRVLAFATGAPAGGPVLRDFCRLARQHVAARDGGGLTRSIETLLNMVAPASVQASALRWCRALLGRFGFEAEAELEGLIAAVETGAPPAADGLACLTTPDRSEAAAAGDLALARRIAREQIVVLETPCDPSIAGGRLDSVKVVLNRLCHALGCGERHADIDAAAAALLRSGDLQPLRDVVETLGAPAGSLAAPVGHPAPARSRSPAPSASEAAEPRTAEIHADGKSIPRVLRVDQAKIDSIMNLVAELIVAKNGLSYLATRAEQVHGARSVAREIKDQFSVIDRITQGLQVGIMSVRMMPVSQVFQRFPRLVRDISRKLGKRIDLVIEGEDTEADKNVLESLADPLIHMVRNSLDHGIETPEARKAVGKPEQGVLRITARQENDFVVIEVRDDGRGIDPKEIKAKSVARGLITAAGAEQMNDEEAVNLVFAAGFSTKDEVSDLSGRGVGMDVVRSAVLKAGGDVALRSVFGSGTSVTVRLPLTMAVTRIVTIECRGRIFGIPMDLVVETVRIRRDQIHRIKRTETFVLRDSIVPIVRLAEALQLVASERSSVAEEGPRSLDEAVMVVRIGRDRVGIVVDGFRERLEVIVKPLEGILDGMPGFSGTALLGDGRVLLILDLQELL